MEVEVNTGEAEIEDAGVRTVRPDENEIVVDTTVEDALDAVIENEEPEAKKAPPPPPVPTKMPSPPPPSPTTPRTDDEDEERSPPRKKKPAPVPASQKKHRKPAHSPAPSPPVENIFGAIDDNPQFARAMRSTLPKGQAPTEAEDWDEDNSSVASSSYSAEEDPVSTDAKKKRHDPTPPAEHSEYEEDWVSDKEGSVASGDSGPGHHSAEEEEEEEGGSIVGSEASVDEEQAKEDEYIEKMKLIEQIKDYAKMGILPPQTPAFSMPISLLHKIRNYMESKADEIMGIGMLGTGWISIIGIIEKLNGEHDPFAKIFGTGLKLTGAKQAVAEKIHLYEAVFKHIYAKIPKSKEMNPWFQFGLITIQILAEVHVKNMREEMEREAEEIARNPRTRQDAERVRKMFEERERMRKEEREAQTTACPVDPKQPKMQPPPSDDYVTEEEETVIPEPAKKDDKVNLQQPTPKEDMPISKPVDDETDADDEEEETKESDSDDDVVVQLPAPKRRGKKEDTL